MALSIAVVAISSSEFTPNNLFIETQESIEFG